MTLLGCKIMESAGFAKDANTICMGQHLLWNVVQQEAGLQQFKSMYKIYVSPAIKLAISVQITVLLLTNAVNVTVLSFEL